MDITIESLQEHFGVDDRPNAIGTMLVYTHNVSQYCLRYCLTPRLYRIGSPLSSRDASAGCAVTGRLSRPSDLGTPLARWLEVGAVDLLGCISTGSAGPGSAAFHLAGYTLVACSFSRAKKHGLR